MIQRILSGEWAAYLLLAESFYVIAYQAVGTYSLTDLLTLPGFVESFAVVLIGILKAG